MNFAIYFSLVFLLSGLAFFGLIVCVTGVVIRWISIIQLDRAFTVDVAISRGHALKTDGIYKWLRHPACLGLLLIVSGLSMVMGSFFLT